LFTPNEFSHTDDIGDSLRLLQSKQAQRKARPSRNTCALTPQSVKETVKN
jgi:hypothetical protein